MINDPCRELPVPQRPKLPARAKAADGFDTESITGDYVTAVHRVSMSVEFPRLIGTKILRTVVDNDLASWAFDNFPNNAGITVTVY